jgi:hypothetical protein
MMGLETEQTPKLHHLVCRNRTNMMLLRLRLQLRHLYFAFIVTKSNIRYQSLSFSQHRPKDWVLESELEPHHFFMREPSQYDAAPVLDPAPTPILWPM